MITNNNKPRQAKRRFARSPAKQEREKDLNIVFGGEICRECGQVYSFKINLENINTSVDDFVKDFDVLGRDISKLMSQEKRSLFQEISREWPSKIHHLDHQCHHAQKRS
jgi:hypothetical protein